MPARIPLAWLLVLLVLGAGCATHTPAPSANPIDRPSPGSVSLPTLRTAASDATTVAGQPAIWRVDSSIPLAVGGDPGWEYQRTAEVDLDGDGVIERAALIAQVLLYRGRPLWEDGHVWQVYVEESDGVRTYIYARFVPNGTVKACLTEPAEQKNSMIILIERTPERLSTYEILYSGPGQAQVIDSIRECAPQREFTGTPD